MKQDVDAAARELCAFVRAVSELFGAEEARIATEDWLDELEVIDCASELNPRDLRKVTIAAAGRLSKRLPSASDRRPLFLA
jgi:hypothetical protein